MMLLVFVGCGTARYVVVDTYELCVRARNAVLLLLE